MADSGKQRLLEQFREANEGERRSEYGGDQIEDTALHIGRLASRSAEAFVRSRMAELMTTRREAAEPPLYDLPFDVTVSPEQPVTAILPAPEPTVLPELPTVPPEGMMVPAEPQIPAESSAPLELPAPTTPEPSAETTEKLVRRRHRSEPEILPAEKKDDSWTPAYQEAPAERHNGATSKTAADNTPEATSQEPGESPRVKTRDASPARKVERTAKTPTDRDAAPIAERRSVKEKGKEKGGVSAAQQPQIMEPGRQKAIREQGRGANPRRTEAHIPEGHNANAHTKAPPAVVDEHSIPQLREQPPAEPPMANPAEAIKTSAPDPPKTPKTGRVAPRSTEASGYHPAPSDAGMTPKNTVLGRQKAIRERTEQSAIRQKNAGVCVSDFTATPGEETFAPNPPKTPKTGRVAPQTAEEPRYHTSPSNPDMTPQNAVSGRRNAIRERTEQSAIRQKNAGVCVSDFTATPGEETFAPNPPKTPKTGRVAPHSTEASEYHSDASNAGMTPKNTVLGRQKAIRERAEKIAEKPVPIDRTVTRDGTKAVRERVEPQRLTPKQEQIPVKTREAYALRRIPPVTGESPIPAEQSRGAFVQERIESGQASIKTKDAYLQSQTSTTETATPRTDEAIPRETPKELRKTVRTREGLIQQPESTAESAVHQMDTPGGKLSAHGRGSHAVEAFAPQTGTTSPTEETALSAGADQRVPDIKTRSAYARKEAALPREQPDHIIEQGRQKFIREQKRKADLKRAAERRPKIREAQLAGEEAEAASEEAKNLAMDRAQQAQAVRTKEAWLRQQGLDNPKERTAPELQGDRVPFHRTAGSLPAKSADRLPGTKVIPGGKRTGGRDFLPTLPGGESSHGSIKARTPPTRFIREKGRSAGGAAANATGKTVRDAAAGGGRIIKTMRPVVVKEAGKAAGKTIKTAGQASRKAVKTAGQASRKTIKTAGQASRKTIKTAGQTSRKAVKTVGTTSAQMIQNAKRAAQVGAKAKAVRDATARAAKQGARTLQEAAQAVAQGAKAAAAALQSLIAGLSAGGGVVLVVLIVICLIGLLVATPFGLFLSGQLGVGDNIQTAVSQLTGEYNAQVQEIQDETPHDELDIAADIPTAMMDNWRNVLSVYAVRVTTDELNATEVVTLTEEKVDILRETFQDMNQFDYYTTSRIIYSGENDEEGTIIVTLHITATTKNAEEMAEEYGFNERQKSLLEELLSSEYDELFDALTGSDPALIPGDLDGVLIPGDVSEARRQVIATGSQLLGKVHYFWGGKSLVLGWDSRWGTPKRVWAAGSPSTGTVRPFGLDCSGYVDWVFYNVSGGTYVIGHGGGASAQHRHCTTIPWSEAQPGDLAFYPGDSHVGIIVGYDEAGSVRIMHCASGSNNVVISGKIGFVTAARPHYYSLAGG